jgi:F420-non-reducing hydrogenase iron-sulfur subunit
MSREVVIYACQQAVPEPEAVRAAFGKSGIRVQVVAEPCSSKVEAFQLLRTLAANMDLVWIIGCPEDLCRYDEGSRRLGSRVAYTRRYLEEIGLEPDRVGRTLLTPGDEEGLAAAVAEIKSRLEALGPTPLKEKAGKGKAARA